MQPSPPRILLLTTLDAIGVTRLPQLFHAAGCHVSVLAPRRLAVCRSRYVAQRFFAEADLDIYLEQLRQHLNTQAYDWVIVCDETLLWELIRRRAANAEAIWIDRCLPVSLTNAELIASKHQFLTAAQDMGLPVPALQLCASLADATQAAQQIGYPVILRAEQSLGDKAIKPPARVRGYIERHISIKIFVSILLSSVCKAENTLLLARVFSYKLNYLLITKQI